MRFESTSASRLLTVRHGVPTAGERYLTYCYKPELPMSQSQTGFYDADDRKWYFEQDLQAVYQFEKLLNQYNLEISEDSSLDKACIEIVRVVEAAKDQIKLDAEKDFRDTWRVLSGITDFIRKVLSVKDHPDFPQLLSHIELLLDPNAGIVQTIKTESINQSAHKIFELYIAIVAMRIGSNVKLESPNAPQSNNPDVIFDYEGESWGIACKMLNSKKPKTYRNRLEEGIDQVERAPVERGFVCMSLKNITPYDVLMPLHTDRDYSEAGHFSSVIGATQRLIMENPFNDGRLSKEWQSPGDAIRTFQGKKAEPFVLEFQSSVVGVLGVCTLLRSFSVRPFLPPMATLKLDLLEFLDDFNRSLHDINVDSRLSAS